MTNELAVTIGAGASLFQAGVTVTNALRFRHMVDPVNGKDEADHADYFDWEIDSLDFYAQSVRALYVPCPRCHSNNLGSALDSVPNSVPARRLRTALLAAYAPTGEHRCIYCGRHYSLATGEPVERTGA